MAEYYKPDKKRTSAKSSDKTPYRKIFLRQLIAAILCFLIINYICSDNIRKKLKDIVNYNIDTNEVFEFFNQLKINEADTNETNTETEL